MNMPTDMKVHRLEHDLREARRDMDELLRLIAQNEKRERRLLRSIRDLESRVARLEKRK
jgi:uncharacterized protein involved in exopolysaccharide biosynthesis